MCHFVLVFFSPFSIAITSLGEERANLSAFRTFVRFVLVWMCRFPLPLGVWEGLWFVIVALPGLFSYLFFYKVQKKNIYKKNRTNSLYLFMPPVFTTYYTGPSFSKLTMSLVNDSLKFTSSDTQICWNFLLKKCECKSYSHCLAKNIRILCIESAKIVNEMALNELVKLTTLWTTGPRRFIVMASCSFVKPDQEVFFTSLFLLFIYLFIYLFNYLFILQYIFQNPGLLCLCWEFLHLSQPNGVMSSAFSLPNHTFTEQA